MSTARGGDRRRVGGRGHLVLVRGGAGCAEPEDADWQAFCARIGWQHVEVALPDDYEERIAARIFPDDARHDGPADIAVERARRAARIAGRAGEGWATSGASDPWRSRRPSMAAATMAVAAILCVAASVMLWQAARPPVGAVACPDVEASPRATIVPVDDRPAPVEPSERRRETEPVSRPPQKKDGRPAPAPSETRSRGLPAPGALVARRSRHDDTRPRGVARSPTRGAEPAPPRDRPEDAAESAAPPPIAAADLQVMASGLGLPDAGPMGVARVASALPVVPRAWPDLRTSDAWTRPASFGQGVMPASATWSLSPGSPRWYGVGLPPSSASAGVPPGVGVMGQLDITKALDRL